MARLGALKYSMCIELRVAPAFHESKHGKLSWVTAVMGLPERCLYRP